MSALESLLVRHIMTDSFITLREHHSLPLASALMFERGVQHLPIVSEENRLIGLLSQRDVLAAELHHCRSLVGDDEDRVDLLVPLGELISREAATLSPDMTARAAAQQLLAHRQGCAPVLDGKRCVVGVVAEDEILALCAERLAGVQLTVADVMTRELTTVRSETSIADALSLMDAADVHHLPIIDLRGNLRGLVSRRDLQVYQRAGTRRGAEAVLVRTLHEFLDRPVWTTTQEAAARDAAQTLRDNHFGCLPVVEEGHLLGIVSQSDLLQAVLDLDTQEDERLPEQVPCNYYVRRPARIIAPDASLAEALQCFAHFGVSTLLVMDEEVLVGILSQSDALRVLQRDRGTQLDPEIVREHRVSDLMSTDLVSIASHQSIGQAAALLMAHHIHHVVVVDDDEPTGILGTLDILAAVRDHRISVPLSDFMTRMIFTIDVRETLASGLRYLARAGISGLVVQEGKRPVGFFGQREAMLASSAPQNSHIEAVMSAEFLCMAAETPAFRGAQQAAALACHRVVVQDAGETVGIISATDFARLLTRVVGH